MLLAPAAAQAQTVTRWQGADMGRWDVAGNWTAGVPDATSTAYLNNVNTAVVEFAGQAQNVLIGESVSSRLIVWDTLTVGDKLSVGMFNQGYLSINSGGTVSAGIVAVGHLDGSSGSGNVQWLSQLTAGTLLVGGFGDGTFGASDGGKIISTTTLIGDQATSTGSLTICYGGSWTNSGSATVGVSGTGTLDVYWASASIGGTLDIGAKGTFNLENSTVSTRSFSNTKGGTFDFPYGTLTVDGGTFQDSSPTLVLDGDWWSGEPAVLELKNNVGSSFCKDLIVGDNYRGGSLTISGGTQFSSDNAYIARLSFGEQNSTVTVTGAGSTWNSNGSVYVGGSASAVGDTGSLTVTSGGHVGVTGTLKVWNTGTVTLNGGSIETQSFDNSAGGTFNFYDGTLTVSGGTWSDTAADLIISGNTAAALPHLVLDNVTSSATYGSVYVGSGNPGQLTVSGGTDLTNTGQVQIGRYAAGTAAADGAGTTWNTGTQFIGVFGGGDGTLNISGGGQVTNAGGRMGYSANTQGSVSVDGGGSAWNCTYLDVGEYGTGYLSIGNGGTVSSTNTWVGRYAGASGDVYLTGAGTKWTNSGSLYIGGDTAAVGGTGMVRVYNGAQLDVGGTLKLWDWDNGTLIIDGGTVTAHGFESAGGSFRFLDGTMTVGGGPLNFAARHLSISGMWTDEKPTFVLDGAVGSTCGELTVGTSYEGTMNIQNGATLTTMGDSLIGRFNGSKGTMTVTGSGTSWTTTGNLHLGGYSGGLGGLGTLNVNSGAVKVNNLLKIWDAGTANLSGGTLSAATIDHTHGGTFNFTGGVLHVGMFQGNLVNQGGAICPGGSPGLTTVQGDLVMNAGLIEIELGGLLRGDLYDAIVVTGLLEVGGTLDVLLYDDGSGPFAPQLENTFDILDWGSLTGQFGQLNLPTLAAGLDWDTSALYTTGDLRVVPEPATLSLLALGGLAALRRRWTAS